VIVSKIHFIRGEKVMLDSDLAELYGVETKRLKEQVKRNIERFPVTFMFELNPQEVKTLRSQIATSNERRGGPRYMPYAFTEHGVLMLANVLKSKSAIDMSIRIIDVFVRMRELVLAHKDIMLQIKKLEKEVTGNTDDIKAIFNYLNEL
jgi:phage regulator Rha-like protein